MKIMSVKAKYELQVAPKLKICFEIDQDEAVCESRCLSFDPESEDYGLIGVLSIYDETEDGLFQSWEEKIDLKTKLDYGFLDELIEKVIFKRLKIFNRKIGHPDKIGSYWSDDPAVVWLTRKETFEKVVRGWAIHDRRIFSGEITGENEKGDVIRLVFGDDRSAQHYINGAMVIDSYIDPKRYTYEEKDANGEIIRRFERVEFMEILDEIEAHI